MVIALIKFLRREERLEALCSKTLPYELPSLIFCPLVVTLEGLVDVGAQISFVRQRRDQSVSTHRCFLLWL